METIKPTESIINPFGKQFEISVDNYLGLKKAVINFPSRVEFYRYMKDMIGDDSASEFIIGEKLLSTGFLSGDTEFLTDEIYIFMGAMESLKEFEKMSAFIKKK